MGIDPALAGGVVLTTITDVVGYKDGKNEQEHALSIDRMGSWPEAIQTKAKPSKDGDAKSPV